MTPFNFLCPAIATVGKAGASCTVVSTVMMPSTPRSDNNCEYRDQQHRIMPVHHCQKEVLSLSQVLLNPADDRRAVGIADLLGNYPDRVRALVAQRARKKIGPVIEFLGCRVDSVLRLLRN